MKTAINGISVIFEDDTVIVVDKPAGLLSQPGRVVHDSVIVRVQEARPEATGPMLVHRLDMDTSGLLILAKNRQAHRNLQQQFEHRNISKRYRAVLEHAPKGLGGLIKLPLRLDVDNRPSQIVCQQLGKSAMTVWRRESKDRPTTVLLYPVTGRTHQLRVHLASALGLGVPILGDRLYGKKMRTLPHHRMMLHAEMIAFDHPVTGCRQRLSSDSGFHL